MTYVRWLALIMLALGLLAWGCMQLTDSAAPGQNPVTSLSEPAARVTPAQGTPSQAAVTPPGRATDLPAVAATPPVGLEATAALAAPPAATITPTRTITVMPATPAPAATITPTHTVTPVPPAPAPTATPGPTPDGAPRAVRVPILMYHYISVPPKGADIYRQDLSVTPERFESHLAYLRDQGYHVVTLDDVLYALAQGRALPEKPVILTFDDGYADNYLNAFPLLQKYGDVGHFFVITDFVNQGRPEYMSWTQIEEMAAAGQRFGSHSRDHPDLRGRSVDYLVWQALGGAEAIQEHLGYHPRWIAYPSGTYDKRTIDVFRSANYWGGLTTVQGATHSVKDVFTLSRVRVRGRYTAEDLGRLLETNW